VSSKRFPLVEQSELQRSALHERPDLTALQRRDPLEPRHVAQVLDGRLPDHRAVADQHHALEAEVALELRHLRHERLRVVGVALVDRHGHRTTAAVGQEAVVDLELVLLAVAVVADLGERAGRPLEVAGGEVVECQASGLQVSGRELVLDRPLALEESSCRDLEEQVLDPPGGMVCNAQHQAQVVGEVRMGPMPGTREAGAGRTSAWLALRHLAG